MEFVTVNGKRPGPIGQGTWYLGEDPASFGQERKALQEGIEQGMTLIDTAEMYGDGAAEELVGSAIQHYERESLYLVSKVYPFNAGRKNIFNSCRNSLRRMRTDYLDLYLLHWRGGVPLGETVECMQELQRQGLIRSWGVSNLDTEDMQELLAVPGRRGLAPPIRCCTIWGSRGVEYDLSAIFTAAGDSADGLLPAGAGGRLRRGLFANDTVQDISFAHDATPAQVLLAIFC